MFCTPANLLVRQKKSVTGTQNWLTPALREVSGVPVTWNRRLTLQLLQAEAAVVMQISDQAPAILVPQSEPR